MSPAKLKLYQCSKCKPFVVDSYSNLSTFRKAVRSPTAGCEHLLNGCGQINNRNRNTLGFPESSVCQHGFSWFRVRHGENVGESGET